MCNDKINKNNSNCRCLNEKNISFKNRQCFYNEIYFGDIIFMDEKIIQVKCKNGNRYMNNQIVEYMYNFL